jgi:cardiolipin synthase
MLDAISQAEHTIALCTYIFDRDEAGAMFGEALEAAVRRHVEVRVLIDSVGARYSWPSMVRELVRRKVPVARFLHSVVPWRMPYMNLRSHRKILVVDGRIGFTGGMNIRAGHLVASNPKSPVQDVHFRVEGPVVGQMMNVFAEDWGYTTRELIDGEAWFPGNPEDGPVVARGIPDGPDRDLDNLRWTMLGALARAHTSVRIVTPYFLPDMTLITSLNLAAMRGVRVQIVLPEVNNLPVVKWASMAQLWQMLLRGCEIYLSPPPFDHSKIMVVDDTWTLIGSANWDPRSLRLNFEYNLECYDAGLATSMSRIVDEKIATARSLSLAEVDGRSFPIRLRDSTARLFAPYL